MKLLILILDWWFSYQYTFGTVPSRTLANYPERLCARLTNHRAELKWADYNADVAGTRCRCGKVDIPR